jgi:hypothetical protein
MLEHAKRLRALLPKMLGHKAMSFRPVGKVL